MSKDTPIAHTPNKDLTARINKAFTSPTLNEKITTPTSPNTPAVISESRLGEVREMVSETDFQVTIPDYKHIDSNSTEADVVKADLELANVPMQMLHAAWGQVKTIGGICKLIDATMKATKHRRDVLKMQYGSKDSGAKRDIVYPLD